ncbi:MAG: D-hexose-6-phosphate mutarotase [Gammaproteobacteria bacterium]|nr:D-hexose-6-phosphate mutarotase [Gammaproteobacteria bacterium]
MTNLHALTRKFAIKDQLSFSEGDNGFTMIEVNNTFASAKISTYGGQIVSFKPHDQAEDLLYLSEQAVYKDGQAIRGGTPVCWPWFGDDTSGLGLPSHGFARNQPWQVVETKALIDGSTSVTLLLSDNDASRSVWPHQFDLYVELVIGKKLILNSTTRNNGNKPFSFTQALHTYFNISDIENADVTGLSGKYYLDKLDGFKLKMQEGNIVIDKEVDRIYQSSPYMVHLIDSGFKRKIAISSSGGHTTVVWNPWADKVIKIKDLDENSYRKFVCVETVNAADDNVVLNPNEQHTLSAVYSIEPLLN